MMSGGMALEKFNRAYRLRFALVNAKGLELGYVYLLDTLNSGAHNIQFSSQISANQEGCVSSSISVYNPPKELIDIFEMGDLVKVTLSVGYGSLANVEVILEGSVAKSHLEAMRSKKRLYMTIENRIPSIPEGKIFSLGTPILSVIGDLLSSCSAGQIKGSKGMEAINLPRDLNFSGSLHARLNFLAEVFQFQWFQVGRNYTFESLSSLKTKMATMTIDGEELFTHPQMVGEDFVLYFFMQGNIFPGDVFELILRKPLSGKSFSAEGVYTYTMQVKSVLHEGVYARGTKWMTRLVCSKKV